MKKSQPITFNKGEIFDFLNTHKRARIATAEGDIPHARSCWIHRADENGIIFHTFKEKDLYKQLCKNPKVEIQIDDSLNGIPIEDPRYHDQIAKATNIRVMGTIEFIEDKELEEEILTKCPTTKHQIEKGHKLVIYRLKKGRAMIQDVVTNLLYPKYWFQL